MKLGLGSHQICSTHGRYAPWCQKWRLLWKLKMPTPSSCLPSHGMYIYRWEETDQVGFGFASNLFYPREVFSLTLVLEMSRSTKHQLHPQIFFQASRFKR